jgi:hypothetical protein
MISAMLRAGSSYADPSAKSASGQIQRCPGCGTGCSCGRLPRTPAALEHFKNEEIVLVDERGIGHLGTWLR